MERGKALQLQCSKRKGRSSSTKSSRADRTKKKKEKKKKLRDSEKNSDKDEDEEEEEDGRNAKEEKEEGSKQKYDSDEGSEVEYNSEDEFEAIRKSVKAENKQSGVEDKRSDCYADDTDEIFGKKELPWHDTQEHAFSYFILIINPCYHTLLPANSLLILITLPYLTTISQEIHLGRSGSFP